MSGSSTQQSSREKPASLRPEVQDKHPALDAHALHDERVIENTFINETSVNEDAYREKMSLVAGFPEGRAILTTYFSLSFLHLWLSFSSFRKLSHLK